MAIFVSSPTTEHRTARVIIQVTIGVYAQPSIDYFLESEVKGSPLNNLFDDESYSPFLEETRKALATYVTSEGKLLIPMDATIVTAQKEG